MTGRDARPTGGSGLRALNVSLGLGTRRDKHPIGDLPSRRVPMRWPLAGELFRGTLPLVGAGPCACPEHPQGGPLRTDGKRPQEHVTVIGKSCAKLVKKGLLTAPCSGDTR